VAHRLIEEFMLAANEAVAKKLLFAKQPAIYRVHDRPDPDRLVDLREVLESFGYELKGDLEEVPPSAFQKLLAEIGDKPEERLLHDLLLRAQRKAVYSEECRGHYALAAPYYCHFTSPIRRYPDLVVHRQLSRLLEQGRPVPARDFEAVNQRFHEIADVSSQRERRAEQAERESLLWKKIVFMRDKVGRDFDAFITGVASFGVFVMLQDFFVEGLVPMSALGNDFFVYEEKQHRLRGAQLRRDVPARRRREGQARRDRRGPAPTELPARGIGRGGPAAHAGADGAAGARLRTGPLAAEEVPVRRTALAALALAAAACGLTGVPRAVAARSRDPDGDLPRARGAGRGFAAGSGRGAPGRRRRGRERSRPRRRGSRCRPRSSRRGPGSASTGRTSRAARRERSTFRSATPSRCPTRRWSCAATSSSRRSR
jgi:hypothetical protein